MSGKKRVFISSVQKELAAERRAVRDYFQRDPLLGRFFDVFLFEDLPASDRRADAVYLKEVDRCDVYLGLFGNEYGYEDAKGLSPTEREFDRATSAGKERLIFVKGDTDSARHPKMQSLVRKAGSQLIRRRFTATADLTDALYASLVDYLEGVGVIQNRPFDERPCPGATLDDIDARAVADFVRLARSVRQFPLPQRTPKADVLAHLHLLADNQPTNAAVLLFGGDPQRFVSCAEVRCMHFHGTEIQRPAPSYQVFKGRLFEQVDRAADFVLSVINRSVGTRALSTQAPVAYEIPPDVVREAIVNAVAHRDYALAGAVQVSVFADRVEVWNPGVLPPPLTPERLREPHGSVARNARICEPLFLTRYIEKYGTGTLMMIRESVEHSLPEPDFEQRAGEFTVTVWRDWLTEAVLATSDLNERQRLAIAHVKITGRMTSQDYRQLTGATPRTTTRDLDDLVDKGLLRKVGKVGRGTHYVIQAKPDKNRTNRPSPMSEAKSAINRTNRPSTPRRRKGGAQS
ncbi:MAG: DUF4062 domain-containing protein [Rhodopirellula sp.]|nr:DUF4062 domain-containing protein [Rhodopirellula sp.]